MNGAECAGYCVSCGAPISAEGTQLCWECEHRKEGTDMNERTKRQYKEIIDSAIEGLNEIKGEIEEEKDEKEYNTFNIPVADVQKVIESGLAPKVFRIGDRFIFKNETFGDMVFAVYGFNQEKIEGGGENMTIGLLDVMSERRAFDEAREGFPYGSNRYTESTIRAWLNGELYQSFNEDFKNAVALTEKITAKNTRDGGGFALTNDRFFLLSRTEVFGDTENEIAEGKQYPFFEIEENRIKCDAGGNERFYALRSPNSGYGDYVRYVDTGGWVNYYFAYYGYAIAPVCVIRQSEISADRRGGKNE